MEVVEDKNNLQTSCNKCSLCSTSSARGIVETCIPGYGSKEAKIILLGMAPAYEEVLQRRPFAPNKDIENAGWMLEKCLVESGIQKEEIFSKIFLTNVVRCRTLNDEAPPLPAIKACVEYLDEEIKIIKPRVIGLLGNVAIERILGKGTGGVSKIRGNTFWSEKYNCTCIPMFHPAYLLRNIEQILLVDYLVQDLRLLKEASLVEKYEKTKHSVTYTVCDTIEKAKELFDNLMKVSSFCFDLETTGFDFFEDDILCASFSYQEYTAFVLPLFLKDNYWKENEVVIIELLKKCFARTDCEKVGHNIKFDMKFLRRIGIEVPSPIFDTMLAHHLLDENARGEHGLKDLAWRYTDIGGYDKEIKDFMKKGLDTAPRDKLYTYSATDSDCTKRLLTIFKSQLVKEGLDKVNETLVLPLLQTLLDVEWVGIKVDKGKLLHLKKKYEEVINDIEFRLRAHLVVKELEIELGVPFNFRSPQQLRKLLFEKLQLPCSKVTPTGASSTDQESLEKIVELHEIPKLLVDHRLHSKIYETYIVGFLASIKRDGRIHTTYLLHGTATGRLSSTEPNLQNIPRDGEIKSVFIPEDGWVFVEADYSQIEFRCWANYSQDPDMIADIKSGNDIHKLIASEVFGIPISEVTKQQRQTAKGTVYGLMYGRGPESLAEEFKIGIGDALRIIAIFFNKYPKAKAFLEDIKKQAKRDGKLRSFFGRIRRLPGIRSRDSKIVAEAERQATNFPFQTMASDITALCSIRTRDRLKQMNFQSREVLTVHDNIVWEVPKGELEEKIKIVYEETSRQLPGITVPLEVEIKIKNSNYGE